MLCVMLLNDRSDWYNRRFIIILPHISFFFTLIQKEKNKTFITQKCANMTNVIGTHITCRWLSMCFMCLYVCVFFAFRWRNARKKSRFVPNYRKLLHQQWLIIFQRHNKWRIMVLLLVSADERYFTHSHPRK